MKTTALCIVMLLMPLFLMAGSDRYISHIYDKYRNTDTDSLLLYAYRDIADGRYDKATALYAVVLNRLEDSSNPKDLQKVARIYNNIGYINFFEYYNFAESYKNYIKSMEISRQIGYTDLYSTLHLNIGNIYAELNQYEKSQDYYLRALDAGIQYHQPEPSLIAFANTLTHALEYNDLESTYNITSRYTSIPDMENASLHRFASLYYKGVCHLQNSQYNEALKAFIQMRDSVDTRFEPERYVLMSYTAAIATYRLMRQYGRAIDEAISAQEYASAHGIANACMWINVMLEELYDLSGRHEEALVAKRNALFLKDSLLNDKTISSIFEIKSSHDIENLSAQIESINQKRKTQNIFTAIILTASVVIMVLLVWLYRKNKSLQENNQELYRKNMEAVRTEQQNARLRKIYENKLAQCQTELEELKQQAEEQQNTGATEETAGTRYKNSPLDDTSKEALLGRILDVMENKEEVFSQDFSLDKLAALTGTKSKYVSQIINETYDKNFNTFLAERRIREACQILSDSSLIKSYTIEAIAANLGFKSRTNFISVFKRVTGLTPSQFKNHIQ